MAGSYVFCDDDLISSYGMTVIFAELPLGFVIVFYISTGLSPPKPSSYSNDCSNVMFLLCLLIVFVLSACTFAFDISVGFFWPCLVAT